MDNLEEKLKNAIELQKRIDDRIECSKIKTKSLVFLN